MMNLGILASGRGSNVGAIADHKRLGVLKGMDVSVIVYNHSESPVAKIAESNGIASGFVDHRDRSRQDFEKEIIQTLDEHDVDLVCLAGWDRIVGSEFCEKYRWRIMNIHPSLLPAFSDKGLNAGFVHEAVLQYGARVTGCTVYFVDISVDSGPIILQKPVDVHEKETFLFSTKSQRAVQILSERVLVQEHRLYSKAIQLYADGLLEVKEYSVNAGSSSRKIVSTHSDGDWEREWASRQRKFIEHQTEVWKSNQEVTKEDLL